MNDGYALHFLKNQTDELRKVAVMNGGCDLQYFKESNR